MPTTSYNIPILPEITDADVDWIANLLNLTLDEERVSFLKNLTNIDVAACPGSGKTTLIVAKLAILVKKWPYKTKGICILSHTNVAREEIEKKLLSIIGNSLFSYPHFIGTIHAFVNRFLALPYLRSQGITNIIIDDALTYEFRKHCLGHSLFFLDKFLSRFHYSVFDLRLKNINYDISLLTKDFPAGKHTPSYKNAQNAVISSVKNGYFCFDEIFIFANALLDKYNEIHKAIAQRFPVIIIDEVQDTNKQQDFIIKRIFFEQDMNVIQRVGDINQSIYNGMEETENCELDFPRPGYHSISKSFRFGQKIANLASCMAEIPFSPHLMGVGGIQHDGNYEDKNTIFIFPNSDTSLVLQAFGELILDSFDDAMLSSKNKIMAIGAVHKRHPNEISQKCFPKSVCDYWEKYTPTPLIKREHLKYLIQYVIAGKQDVNINRCFVTAVNKIATGIFKFAQSSGNKLKIHSHPHRQLLLYIRDSPDGNIALKQYNKIITNLLVNNLEINENNWNKVLSELDAIFVNVFPNKLNFRIQEEFLKLHFNDTICMDNCQETTDTNIYTAKKNEREVNICLDSIHSIKGQTHFATLILDTYCRTHFFKHLLPRLIGSKSKVNPKTLRLAYVAMTRPTHLLCLAIAESSLGAGKTFEKNINNLQERGWIIQHL